MVNKKGFLIMMGIVFSGVIVFAILHSSWRKNEWIEDYREFYSSDINGTLTHVSGSSSGTFFSLDNKEGRFNFHPIMSDLNNNSSFSYTAQKGDRIIKPAYSDTLTLITGEGKYKYTFENLADLSKD